MFTDNTQFWNYVFDNYDEKKQLIIEKLMVYYINKNISIKFKHNYEPIYQECIKMDTSGELNRLALIGTEFEKKILNKIKILHILN
jgi:hypothetical protein